MVPIIFLGPSLSMKKAREVFPFAEYRSPARKGDILRIATRHESNFIGLIDGVFLQDYPPTPIEVYTALSKSVKIVGAASIGAVRAVELEKFGMIGVGKIFKLYKSGKLEDDDEIAVTFADDYKLQSEALIDIRYTLYHAYKDGIIDYNTRRELIKIAKKIYFPYRTYDEILNKARGIINNNILAKLEEYIAKNRKSLKEEDSIRLLNYMKKLYIESLRV
jgi:hypothetical protein